MAKIITADGAAPASPPDLGTHAVYSKAGPPGVAGLYVMDDAGDEEGPLSAGGGPPSGDAGGVLSGTYPNPVSLSPGVVGTINIAPLAVTTTELANGSVTDPKLALDAVTETKIFNGSVTTGKLGDSAVTSLKIANFNVTSPKLGMTAVPYGFILSDSIGGPWVGGLPLRIKFVSPSRISILGDLGPGDNPAFPRLVDSQVADVDLGYLSKTLSYYIKIPPAGGDLNLIITRPTVFEFDVSGSETVYLPDSRAYPPGTVLTFVQTSSGLVVIGKTNLGVVGGWGDIKQTLPEIPAADQILLPGQTKKFITFGGAGGWWVSREVFSRTKDIPLASGVCEVANVTGASQWNADLVSFTPWRALVGQRWVMFPVDLPYGAILTGVDALVRMTSGPPVLGSRTKLSLYRQDLNYMVPSEVRVLVAPAVEAAGSVVIQKIPLTGLSEFIDPGLSQFWTVVVESSTNAFPNGDALYGVRLTYTL